MTTRYFEFLLISWDLVDLLIKSKSKINPEIGPTHFDHSSLNQEQLLTLTTKWYGLKCIWKLTTISLPWRIMEDYTTYGFICNMEDYTTYGFICNMEDYTTYGFICNKCNWISICIGVCHVETTETHWVMILLEKGFLVHTRIWILHFPFSGLTFPLLHQ